MAGESEQQLRAYVEYFRDLGVYELYQRKSPQVGVPERWRELLARPRVAPVPTGAAAKPGAAVASNAQREMPQARPGASAVRPPTQAQIPQTRVEPEPSRSYFETLPQELQAPMPKPVSFDALAPLPAEIVPADKRVAALRAVQAEIGDCTRCPLAYAGRHKIVFADGDPNATLMFVGEGPGADEDAQGLPFVGRAGLLLTQMIDNTASKEGIPIRREDVYICNVVKCRPPENRTPLPEEMEICGEFLFRQLVAIKPKAICALGSTAAKALLATKDGVTRLRGNWHKWRDIPVMVTYHPSYLLRPYNANAKREAWDDLKKVLHFVYD